MEGMRRAVVVDGQRHGVGTVVTIHGVWCIVATVNLSSRNLGDRDI